MVEILVDQRGMVDQRHHDRRFAQRHHAAGALDHRRARQAFRHGKAAGRSAGRARTGRPAAACPRLSHSPAAAGLRALRAEEGLHALAHVLRVVEAHVLVLDAAGELAQRLFELGRALRRVEDAA